MFDLGLLFIPEPRPRRIRRQVKLLEGELQGRWRYSYPHCNALPSGKDKGREGVTMDAKVKNLSILTGDNSVLSVYRHCTLHAAA